MAARYFVPDLSPQFHPEIKSFRPNVVFVAESPHVNEVEPEKSKERRPLCGAAGKAWWAMLGELREGAPVIDLSLTSLLSFCQRHSIAVMNAVQYPLDPKITRSFPEADPVKALKFAKIAGEFSYKKLKKGKEVRDAIQDLRIRLMHPSVAGLPIYPLGNDADWFIRQALTEQEAAARVLDRIPHPSAWWRQGGLFERIARKKLQSLNG
jgi:hypothetical protein